MVKYRARLQVVTIHAHNVYTMRNPLHAARRAVDSDIGGSVDALRAGLNQSLQGWFSQLLPRCIVLARSAPFGFGIFVRQFNMALAAQPCYQRQPHQVSIGGWRAVALCRERFRQVARHRYAHPYLVRHSRFPFMLHTAL